MKIKHRKKAPPIGEAMRMTRPEAERIAEELADSPYPIVPISDALMQACKKEAEPLQPGPCGVKGHRRCDCTFRRLGLSEIPGSLLNDGITEVENYTCLACRREAAAGEAAAREMREKCIEMVRAWNMRDSDADFELKYGKIPNPKTKNPHISAIRLIPLPTLALDAVVKVAQIESLMKAASSRCNLCKSGASIKEVEGKICHQLEERWWCIECSAPEERKLVAELEGLNNG